MKVLSLSLYHQGLIYHYYSSLGKYRRLARIASFTVVGSQHSFYEWCPSTCLYIWRGSATCQLSSQCVFVTRPWQKYVSRKSAKYARRLCQHSDLILCHWTPGPFWLVPSAPSKDAWKMQQIIPTRRIKWWLVKIFEGKEWKYSPCHSTIRVSYIITTAVWRKYRRLTRIASFTVVGSQHSFYEWCPSTCL